MSILKEAEMMINEPHLEAKNPIPEMVPDNLPSPVNDVKDTVNTFLDRIAKAQMSGDQYVEISDEVFDHYMRGQKTQYFYYQSIRVYRYGTKEAIERDEQKTT